MLAYLTSFIPYRKVASGAWTVLTSKIGLVCIAAALGFMAGMSRGDGEAELTALKTKVASLQADLSIARMGQELATKQASDLSSLDASNRERIDALVAERAKLLEPKPLPQPVEVPVAQPAPPAPADCRLDAGTAAQLRAIR